MPLFCTFENSFFTARVYTSGGRQDLAKVVSNMTVCISSMVSYCVCNCWCRMCDYNVEIHFIKSLIKSGILLLTTKLIELLNAFNFLEHEVVGSMIDLCWQSIDKPKLYRISNPSNGYLIFDTTNVQKRIVEGLVGFFML